ncbi:MAG: hypothetical protein Q7T81_15055 [Pseudolabrys sp.]|nr:hypothetical protein [Pseudolabrys sp.]
MNRIAKTLTKTLALAAAAASLSTFAPADANAGSFWIKNSTPHYIWYTVYNAGFRTQKKQWGCLNPNSAAFNASNSAYGAISANVYVLGEIKKSSKDCGGSNKWTIGPTMVTIDPNGGKQIGWNSTDKNSKPQISINYH